MHVLAGADDRVDRAGLDAFGATDAVRFHHQGDHRRLLLAAATVVRQRGHAQDMRQCARTHIATWRAMIDTCVAGSHRFGIRPATIKPALPALRLRQETVEAFDQFG